MLNGKIDLRSDTIAHPCEGMREVMAQAIVGDDVLGDDPTVANLEQNVADLLGKEASLYTPSGTMANQLGIRVQTRPGDEIILDANAHIYCYEAGAPAALSGVTCNLLDGRRGIFTAQQLESALRPRNDHFPPTRLVCLENTHNRGGGSMWPLSEIKAVATTARRHGLTLHLDGARLWNASIASGVSMMEHARHFDTVSVCFSKGLGAPVGSALAGPRGLIDKARFYRKQQGGGMRQVGILAAGALFALENNFARLHEDHKNARKLAVGLATLPGVSVDANSVETNIVMIGLDGMDASHLQIRLDEANLRLLATDQKTLRAVTNLTVNNREIDQAVGIFGEVLEKGNGKN